MLFFLYQEEEKKLDRPLRPGGPLLYYKSKLTWGQQDTLVELKSADTIVVCEDGNHFMGIVRRITDSRDGWVGVEMFGLVENFPIDLSGGIPGLGECGMVAAQEAKAVRVVPPDPKFPVHNLLSIDGREQNCCFEFEGKYVFGGQSIIYR